MKVKIIKAGRGTYWYANKIGEVFDVDNLGWLFINGSVHHIQAEDCIELTEAEALEYDLNKAKQLVAVLEAKLEAEKKAEANKPFTREQYEATVAKYRACKGRVKPDGYCHSCFQLYTPQDVMTVGDWNSITAFPFGVAFPSHELVKQAINHVGAENLRKAWEFEMNIGLEN